MSAITLTKEFQEVITSQMAGLIIELGPLCEAISKEFAERERAEQALRESEERYRLLVSSLGEGVMLRDANGNILAYNIAAERILGLTLEQLTGRAPIDPKWQTVHEDLTPFRAEHHPGMVALLTGQPQKDVIMGVQKPTGETTWISINAQPMFKAGEEYPYAVVTALSDITKRKHYENNAILLGVERNRSELLAGFIRDASHEFRTPLSIIQTSLYLLNKSQSPEVREQKTRAIEQQVRTIDHLVAMLGIQADLDTQRQKPSEASVNLNDIIWDLHQEFQAKALDNRLILTAALANQPAMVIGDMNLLRLGLAQIVDNAIRYTLTGGEVVMRVEVDPDAIIMTVQDNGVGIPDDSLPHIFTRFYRRDVAHTTPGFGLGLSIAARVIEEHGGKIAVQSAVGVGSAFIIRLPRTG